MCSTTASIFLAVFTGHLYIRKLNVCTFVMDNVIRIVYWVYFLVLVVAGGLTIAEADDRAAPWLVLGMLSSHFLLGGYEAWRTRSEVSIWDRWTTSAANIVADALLLISLVLTVVWVDKILHDHTFRLWLPALALVTAVVGNIFCVYARHKPPRAPRPGWDKLTP
jgi:hypothetical protein